MEIPKTKREVEFICPMCGRSKKMLAPDKPTKLARNECWHVERVNYILCTECHPVMIYSTGEMLKHKGTPNNFIERDNK